MRGWGGWDRGEMRREAGGEGGREALTQQQVPAQQLVGVHERGLGEAAIVGGARRQSREAVESRLGGDAGARSLLLQAELHPLLLLLLVEAGREQKLLLLLLEHLQLSLQHLLLLLCRWRWVGACRERVGGLHV
jgi:hypothetical protein